MKLNKNKLIENRSGVIRGEGVVEWAKWVRRVEGTASSYKVGKSWGYDVQRGNYN